MKTRIFAILGIVGAICFSSCNLDQYPYSEFASDEYVTDDNSVNDLVTGCYNGLHDVMYYEWAMTELRSDNARMFNNNSTSNTTKLIEQLDQSVINTEHEWVERYWKACYALISRTNNVLANVQVVKNEDNKKMYEGEARFLRALEYFNLVRLWGPVFIVTSKTPSDVARNMQRSSVADVYALIEGDLETIVEQQLLPAKQADALLGRADMNAAKALLAKVYATHYAVGDEKYQQAINLCKEVLGSETVGNPQTAADLVPYASVFDINNEMNKEIIFAVRYLSGNIGLGSPFGNLFAPINNGANVIVGTANWFNAPSDNLINAYIIEGDETRRNVNIAQKYYNATTGQWIEATYCCKYTRPVTTGFDGESDWPIIRVGDIALLYAELLNETAGPSAEALKYVNMIRERAGIAPYTLEQVGNKYDFRMAVRNERRLELAFENQRWFDLKRWDIATETINNYLSSEAFYAGYTYRVNPISNWQNYLPIPVSVTNINPDVAQNAGY